MRIINLLVVHCSATKASMDIGADWINTEHVRRGFLKIGYHYVIRRNGTIERGRTDPEIGAHAQGHNANSLGICMVGGLDATGQAENNFTAEQFDTLEVLLKDLLHNYPGSTVLGHRDLSPDLNGDGIISPNEYRKICPCFDVRDWMKSWT